MCHGSEPSVGRIEGRASNCVCAGQVLQAPLSDPSHSQSALQHFSSRRSELCFGWVMEPGLAWTTSEAERRTRRYDAQRLTLNDDWSRDWGVACCGALLVTPEPISDVGGSSCHGELVGFLSAPERRRPEPKSRSFSIKPGEFFAVRSVHA